MMTLLSLIIHKYFLWNKAKQSSSHNCPMDKSDKFFRSGYISASFACVDNGEGKGKYPFEFVEISALFGNFAFGPFAIFWTLFRALASISRMKCLDAPESALRKRFLNKLEKQGVRHEEATERLVCFE